MVRGRRRVDLRAQLREQAWRSASDVVLVDRLQVLLMGADEARSVQLGKARARRRRSSRARSPRRTAGGHGLFPRPRPRRSASSARRSPRTCSTRRSPAAPRRRSRRRTPRCSRSAACPDRAGCGSRRAPARRCARSARSENPSVEQALARAARDQLLRARAGGHAGRGHADDAARAVLECDGASEERVDLLRAARPRRARACARDSAPRS